MEADGDIDLYAQASQIFGQLQRPNDFTAAVNTFHPVPPRIVPAPPPRRGGASHPCDLRAERAAVSTRPAVRRA